MFIAFAVLYLWAGVAFDFYAANIIETIAIAVTGEADTTTAKNDDSSTIGEAFILGTDLEISRFHGLTGFRKPDIAAPKRGREFDLHRTEINLLAQGVSGIQAVIRVAILEYTNRTPSLSTQLCDELTAQTVHTWCWATAIPRASSKAPRISTAFWLIARFCAKLVNEGVAITSSIAAMATVIINSIRVNARMPAYGFILKLLKQIKKHSKGEL